MIFQQRIVSMELIFCKALTGNKFFGQGECVRQEVSIHIVFDRALVSAWPITYES